MYQFGTCKRVTPAVGDEVGVVSICDMKTECDAVKQMNMVACQCEAARAVREYPDIILLTLCDYTGEPFSYHEEL